MDDKNKPHFFQRENGDLFCKKTNQSLLNTFKKAFSNFSPSIQHQTFIQQFCPRQFGLKK